MPYYPVIGLEIHVQLNTVTKLFCSCLNEYSPDEPNKNICPFCTGQPGALPVLNKAAVQKAIMFGVAVGAHIPEKTRWDRKNYFYPDLPAGYQISQYDNPIVEGGHITFYIEDKKTGVFEQTSVDLTRAHLEADAAKLIHGAGRTMVDFNRSGAPLIEIVTEPVIRSSAQAMAFVNELQLLVRKLGISDADMEKGQMRFDCNVSLQTEDQNTSNTLPSYRTETKNINSVRSLGRAIEYEIERQSKLLLEGTTPVQETRGWKDDLGRSETQRSKEDAMDYRYFPEPDLQILIIDKTHIPSATDLPELPSSQRERYLEQGLSLQVTNTFVVQEDVGSYFDAAISALDSDKKHLTKTIANIIAVNLISLSVKLEKPVYQIIGAEELITLSELFEKDKINNQGLMTALEIIANGVGLGAMHVVESHGLLQISDEGELTGIVDEVITANPKVVEEYKSGKVQVIGFLVGQCMKKSGGKGNPKKFNELLAQSLSD